MVSFFWCNEQVNCSIHSKFTKLFNYLFSQKNCDKCHVTCKSKQSKTWDSIFGLFYRNFTRVRCHCARTGARTQRSSKGDEYQRGCNGDGSCTRGRMVKASRAVVVTLHCTFLIAVYSQSTLFLLPGKTLLKDPGVYSYNWFHHLFAVQSSRKDLAWKLYW